MHLALFMSGATVTSRATGKRRKITLISDKGIQSAAPKMWQRYSILRFRILEQLQNEDNLNKAFNIIQSRY